MSRRCTVALVVAFAGAPACAGDHPASGVDAGAAGAAAGGAGEGEGGGNVNGSGGGKGSGSGSGGGNGSGSGGGNASGGGSGNGSGGGSSNGSGGARASGGVGGSAGGGGSGAGAAAGNSGVGGGCAGTHYILCEDFESTKVGAIPSGWTKHGDASGVADDAAKHGTHSLKLGAIPVWERRIYHSASGVGSAHWGRVFYKVELPVPDAFVHSTMVAFSGNGPVNGPSEFRVVDTVKQAKDTKDVGSRHQFLYNVQPQNHDEFGKGTSYDYTFDANWHCAEWHIDASNQSYHFYFEGTEKIGFENGAGKYDGSDIPMSFGEIKIGWINYQDSPPGFVAWLDDIAVSDTRIGCD